MKRKVVLKLKNVETAYGQSQVLFGMDLEIKEGEAVSLLGRNGMGKTTTIHTIMGIVPARSGEIVFAGNWNAEITTCTGMILP